MKGKRVASLWGSECVGASPWGLRLSDGGEVDGSEKDDGKASLKLKRWQGALRVRRPASARPAVWWKA